MVSYRTSQATQRIRLALLALLLLAALRPGMAPQASAEPAAPATVHLRFDAASPVLPMAGAELPGKLNYLLGDDPAQWRTDVPTYASIVYPGLYPGVDL